MPIVTSQNTNVCPECGGSLALDDKRGEVVCQTCGLVVEEKIVDAYPEIVDEKVQREEPVKDKIYPQFIFGSRDAHGNPVDAEMIRRRKRTAGVFNLKPDDRMRLKITRDINQICSVYGLPAAIADRAIFIYRKTIENKLIMKPSMKDLSLSSIITACRERHAFIDVNKICRDNGVGKPATPLRYCHVISRGLSIDTSIPTTESYISKFVSDLKESREVEQEAIRIVRLYNKFNVNAKCLAAAAVYLGCWNVGQKKTQREIKDITATSEVTIRTWVKELCKIPGVIKVRETIDSRIDYADVED